MSKIEQRINEAYSHVSMPQGLKAKTLDYVACKNQAAINIGTTTIKQPILTRKKRRMRTYISALAACLILAVAGFGSASVYADQTAFVSIEVNPSMELGINRFNIVVSAQAYNEDAQRVLDETSLTGKTYDDAIAALNQNETFMSTITADSFVDISIACDDENQAAELQISSEVYLQSLPCASSCRGVSSQTHAQAQEHHMGTARYEAARELIELDPSYTWEDCASMSMRELRDRIAEAGGSASLQGQGQGRGQGQGQGQGAHHGWEYS